MGRLIDLTGQKFGRLKVIKRSYPNDKWGQPFISGIEVEEAPPEANILFIFQNF